MRVVLWLVLLFAVAVVAATTFGRNDGLVSLYWDGWRTDLSLNLFVLLMLAACALLISAVLAARALLTLPDRASQWRALRRERAAQAAFRDALSESFGGRFGRARKAAERALSLQADAPGLSQDAQFRVLAQLLAAGSLHRLQDRAGRDGWVEQALQIGDARGAEEAVRLLSAEWALDDRDASRALELLSALPPGTSRRTHALRLKLRAARLAGLSLEALSTARLLAKHQAFSPAVARSLRRSLAAAALEGVHDVQQLRRLWSQFDAAERRDPLVVARAALRAGALQAPDDARQWLRPFWDGLSELGREDREQVALSLIEVRQGLGPEWLPSLENAAQTYGQESAIVAAVGLAYAERQLWGKARLLLEQAAAAADLPARTRRQSWRALAALAREEDDEPRALRCEQAAAALD